MNIGINNNYHYGPTFGNLYANKRGVEKINSHPSYDANTRDVVFDAMRRAETSQKADLHIDSNGHVYVGLDGDKYKRMPAAHPDLEDSTLRVPMKNDKGDRYIMTLKFDDPEAAKAVYTKNQPGERITAETTTIFNAIEDGARYTIKPVEEE